MATLLPNHYSLGGSTYVPAWGMEGISQFSCVLFELCSLETTCDVPVPTFTCFYNFYSKRCQENAICSWSLGNTCHVLRTYLNATRLHQVETV